MKTSVNIVLHLPPKPPWLVIATTYIIHALCKTKLAGTKKVAFHQSVPSGVVTLVSKLPLKTRYVNSNNHVKKVLSSTHNI
jgi:hypothetical protein